jgi:hypothetical protein
MVRQEWKGETVRGDRRLSPNWPAYKNRSNARRISADLNTCQMVENKI